VNEEALAHWGLLRKKKKRESEIVLFIKAVQININGQLRQF